MKQVFLVALSALVVVGALWFVFSADKSVPQEEEEAVAVYQNERYGFSFTVPESYEVLEYADESVAVGTPLQEEGMIDVLANVRVYTSGPEVGYESYNEFVATTLRNMCAADGPTGTMYCTEVSERQPFVSESGLQGEVLYLARIHEDFAADTTVSDSWGPLFVFNIQANVPAAQFAFMAVEPPANQSTEEIDSEVVRGIADSLTISVIKEPRQEEVLALVHEVEAEDMGAVVHFDPVEWLQGDEAYAAVAADTDCQVENAEECMPSLYNNFYIRNVDIEDSVYPLASSARVELIAGAEPVEQTLGDLETKLQAQDELVMRLTIVNGQITALAEVYLP